MAKRSKQALAELDEAIDQLGGGAAPLAPQMRAANRVRTESRSKPKAKRKVAAATRRKK